MKIKLKWHKFLCGIFGHKWHYFKDNDKRWFLCKRCAKAESLEPIHSLEGETNDKNKLFKLIVIAILIFFAGYFVRSIHYRQDLPRIEKIQVELNLKYEKVEGQFMPLVKSAIKALEGYEEIIEQNRRHPVIPFVELEEEL